MIDYLPLSDRQYGAAYQHRKQGAWNGGKQYPDPLRPDVREIDCGRQCLDNGRRHVERRLDNSKLVSGRMPRHR